MTGRSEKLRGFLAGILVLTAGALGGCGVIQERFEDKAAPPAIQEPAAPGESIHLFFGNPSNAVQDENAADNFLVLGDGSAISYNNTRGTANWVSWRTTKADLGPSLRRPDFSPDPRLPGWYKRIVPSDYSGSGYDRGHMVPSADRFANTSLNEETFLMTNIVPQTQALNQYPWEKLESYARGQARRGFDVYQIAGIYGNKGILNGKVIIPTNCWKIIAIVPKGRLQADERTRIIAVDMPNVDNIGMNSWERYKTTVRKIEEAAGLNVFSQLPEDLQDTIETRIEMSSRTR